MTDLILPRRSILKSAVGIVAFPAIVRAESLMRVVAQKELIRRTLPSGMVIEYARDWDWVSKVLNPPAIIHDDGSITLMDMSYLIPAAEDQSAA
jgi:hypothetical protein